MTDDQFLVIAGLLSDIRDALVPEPEAPAEDESGACVHPEGARVAFPTFQRPNQWICSLCKYESLT